MVRPLFSVSPKSKSFVLSFGPQELVAMPFVIGKGCAPRSRTEILQSLADVPEQFIMSYIVA
jgi:hypothetical protein